MTSIFMHERRETGYSLLKSGWIQGAYKHMKLDYYLFESHFYPGHKSEDDKNNQWNFESFYPDDFYDDRTFGICVVRTEEDSFEEVCVNDVTADAQKAAEILNLLSENLVTPCCLREVLEDICASG